MSDLSDFIRHVHDPQTKNLRNARARVRELEAALKETRRILNDPLAGTFAYRLDLIDKVTVVAAGGAEGDTP